MDPQVPFGDYARPRPLRTYSHKARTASPSVLPLLRTRDLPASLARKHQREPEPQDKNRQDDGTIPEEETIAYQAEYDFEDAYELEFEPQYASDTSQSPDNYTTEEDASLEYSTDEDENERKPPEESNSTPPSSVKSSTSTKYISKSATNQSNRLRRRPFLLFDKLPPRGFKRLKPKAEDNTTSTLSAKYKLGDGFSKDEAKPNGLVQLGLRPTAKRKAPHVESKVGALNLTQSSFTRSPKKDPTVKQQKTKTKKRAYDNSFLPDPKRAERQRKRHKLLKKKDNPLEDKEMLPPTIASTPKIILTSTILGEYSNLAERRPHAAAVAPSKQQKQTQNEGASGLKEVDMPPYQDDNEEGNIDFEEPIAREPSVELGESPARKEVPAHSAFNHQDECQQQKATPGEHQEDTVEVLSEEAVEQPVTEPVKGPVVEEALDQPAEKSSKELLEQPLENPSEKTVKKLVEEQAQPANHVQTGESHSRLVTIKESASASDKVESKSSFEPSQLPGSHTIIRVRGAMKIKIKSQIRMRRRVKSRPQVQAGRRTSRRLTFTLPLLRGL
ncbi:hypothetical protein N0V85_000300 [Neurospora sp. IMI 360204]|nr:hypothetical protein N0V85_000300 [Neurospora sp. IMI 360204]